LRIDCIKLGYKLDAFIHEFGIMIRVIEKCAPKNEPSSELE